MGLFGFFRSERDKHQSELDKLRETVDRDVADRLENNAILKAAGLTNAEIDRLNSDRLNVELGPCCLVSGGRLKDPHHAEQHEQRLQWCNAHPLWDKEKQEWRTQKSMGVKLKVYQASSQTKSVWSETTLIGYVVNTKLHSDYGVRLPSGEIEYAEYDGWCAHNSDGELLPHPNSPIDQYGNSYAYPHTRIVAVALLFNSFKAIH